MRPRLSNAGGPVEDQWYTSDWGVFTVGARYGLGGGAPRARGRRRRPRGRARLADPGKASTDGFPDALQRARHVLPHPAVMRLASSRSEAPPPGHIAFKVEF